MVAKLRGSGERLWSTLGSGLAHTASHSAVWIDFALDVAGESATATTIAMRSQRIVASPAARGSTPSRAPSIPSWVRAHYLLGGAPPAVAFLHSSLVHAQIACLQARAGGSSSGPARTTHPLRSALAGTARLHRSTF